MVPEAPEIPTISRAAALAMPNLVQFQATTCAMGRDAVPVGSGRGEIVEFDCFKRAHQAIHRIFRKARAEHAFISREIGPCGGGRTSLAGARTGAAAGIDRLLLQALRLKLDRFDPGAER